MTACDTCNGTGVVPVEAWNARTSRLRNGAGMSEVSRDGEAGAGAVTDTTLSTVDAAQVAGVTVRQLHAWTSAGYLSPSIVKGPGQGGKSIRWTPREVDRAEMLGVLSRTVCVLGTVAGHLDADGPAFTLRDGPYEITVRVDLSPLQADGGGVDGV